MSRRGTGGALPGMAVLLLLVYGAGLLAALTQVMHRLWPHLDARAGVFVEGLVPVHPSLGLAAVLSVAYAAAVVLLYERSRFAWWYCLALIVAVAVLVHAREHDAWITAAVVLVLLVLPPVRREVNG